MQLNNATTAIEFEHVRLGRISILDESSNLLLILQHDSGNEFWIRKNPTKADLRLMKQKKQGRFITETFALAA